MWSILDERLWIASRAGQLAPVKELVAAGANVNYTRNESIHAVHAAAPADQKPLRFEVPVILAPIVASGPSNGLARLEIIETLVRAGASVNARVRGACPFKWPQHTLAYRCTDVLHLCLCVRQWQTITGTIDCLLEHGLDAADATCGPSCCDDRCCPERNEIAFPIPRAVGTAIDPVNTVLGWALYGLLDEDSLTALIAHGADPHLPVFQSPYAEQDIVLGPAGPCWPAHVGQAVDARDAFGRWYPASVMDLDVPGRGAHVHFLGWPAKYNEWISADRFSGHLATPGTHLTWWTRRRQSTVQLAERIRSTSIRQAIADGLAQFAQRRHFVGQVLDTWPAPLRDLVFVLAFGRR